MIALLLNHLWQSSLCVAGAGLLALALHRNGANVRFWLWFAASVKFLVPFAVLTAVGGYVQTPFLAPIVPPPPVVALMEPLAKPFAARTMALTIAEPVAASAPAATMALTMTQRPSKPSGAPAVVLTTAKPAPAAARLSLEFAALAFWIAGFLFIALRWLVRWSRLRALLQAAVAVPVDAPIAVKFSSSRLGPGLVGILKPVILLPHGIEQQLSAVELKAVLAHELCHWRRHDNLLAAIHMLVEALFWFFPLVWWLGARLNAERERACDESVLAQGNDPQNYAEGILKVCRAYLQSPLACVAGISGAGLKKRIDAIMENRLIPQLNAVRKLVLSASAALVLVPPLIVGLAVVPAVQMQAKAAATLLLPARTSAPATSSAGLNQPGRDTAPSQKTASALPSQNETIATSQPESLAPPSPDLSGVLSHETLATPTVIASARAANDQPAAPAQPATQAATPWGQPVVSAAPQSGMRIRTEAASACLLGFAPEGCEDGFAPDVRPAVLGLRVRCSEGPSSVTRLCFDGPLDRVDYLGANTAGVDVYEVRYKYVDTVYLITPPGLNGKIPEFRIMRGNPNAIIPSSLVDVSASAAPRRTLYLRSADTGAAPAASSLAQSKSSSATTSTDQAANYDKAAVASATDAVNRAFDSCKARLAANEIQTYSEMAACSLAAEHNFFTAIKLKRMDVFETYADSYQALAADRDAHRVSERQAGRKADKILREFYAECKCGPTQRTDYGVIAGPSSGFTPAQAWSSQMPAAGAPYP